MAFRGMLRPGQGFKPFKVLRRGKGVSASGRPHTSSLEEKGEFFGILSQASPREQEQWKQKGSPITHTILQRGTKDRANADDILMLSPPARCGNPPKPRFFLIKGEPRDPGELGHFLVYHAEERNDLK